MNNYDLASRKGALDWLRENYPPISGGLYVEGDDPALEWLSRYCYEVFVKKSGGRYAELEAGLESFAHMSFDFLRLQSRFLKTGQYELSSANELLNGLYLNNERMERYYLDGLLLTYSFWPNHLKLVRFFRDRFLGPLPTRSRFLEIGVGHGFMSGIVLSHIPKCHYTGLDISPSSLTYARKLWVTNDVDHTNAVLAIANAVEWDPPDNLEERWDAAICCEVLEHVEKPAKVMKSLRHALKPGARVFITTVANVAAEDHIHLFEHADEIRELCSEAGFIVADDKVWPLKGFESAKSLPLNYAAILFPK